ncbi:hypothetical protein ABZY16_02200 [Streptomyces sp. NPDC006553]|uniref:hypothetical protein n=1 Tax=unclassified Streptomyces TaxID=2593676 RepID=UPI002259C498|nr:hypothetical protein [Streptomyces sp. NBC_00233]MCX5227527.1 hypothetical protein [Streptomyces sp. NBC_00233]
MRMPKQDLAAFSSAFNSAFSTALTGTAKLGATAQDTGPAPTTRRPPRRELPRTARSEARHRLQAPRRTY